MDLDKSKWYVRWYFWSLGICEEFGDAHSLRYEAEKNGTNLCAFMRTIIIYAPLIILLNAVIYVGAFATITVLPIYFFGLTGYGLAVGALALFCVLVYLTILKVVWLQDKRNSRAVAQDQVVNTTRPSFARVLGRWVVAKKRKVCPLITFVKPDKEVRQ